jgi:hypothetical protein
MKYPTPFALIEGTVKPEWEKDRDKSNTSIWWWHRRRSEKLYRSIAGLKRAIAVGFTSKIGRFAFVPNNVVFSNSVVVVCSDSGASYACLDSSLHEAWAWKYAGTMKCDLRYTPSDIFETYPFPPANSLKAESDLEQIGERYHEHRRELMVKLQLGLTKTYNLFHNPELSVELVAKESKHPLTVAQSAHTDLLQLRVLHMQMDQAVLAAYGWHQPSDAGPAIALRHDFYDVDYLPENDRIRYTIHPDARKELLKRLLAENHRRAEEDEKCRVHKKTESRKSRASAAGEDLQGELTLGG